MTTYKIFASPLRKHEAVKQGWSWPGFFFNIIWALVKRMWALGITLSIVFFLLGWIEWAIEVQSGEEAALGMRAITIILSFIMAIVFGINGNRWREKNLLSRGFEHKDTLNADNPEAAIALWIKENGNR